MSRKSGFLLAALAVVACSARVCAISDSAYYDKVRGAWLGKCIGGALGMPLEGWKYTDIDRAYPRIDGYVGYFGSGWRSWSGMTKTEPIQSGGGWHVLTVALRVPEFDIATCFAVPIIGTSFEAGATPGAWDIRDLKVLRPKSDVAFNQGNWVASSGTSWGAEPYVHFDYKGERAWLKLASSRAQSMRLKPGDTLLLSMEAKGISGRTDIGFAFDFITRDNLKGFGPDDDTSYQIVGLHTLETVGPDIGCKDIGKQWCELLPNIDKSLAEGLALERMKQGIAPPESGVHKIGEAIGGQMKGEIWGLICPGRPELAAEYARRDGVVAHCKNGVYGEQFIAAMTAASFGESDPAKLIQTGLSVIPRDSQYAETVRWVVDLHAKYPDYRDTRRELIAKYPNACDPVYADAGVVTLGLLYGGGDFDKSMRITASCGSDTDCDCASVGALLGCIRGAKAIPKKWTRPIDDTFRCFVKGYEYWKISDLSKRICAMGHKVQAFHGSGVKFTSGL